jgi:transketolase C-terminal domain/subunit
MPEKPITQGAKEMNYPADKPVATRKAYGKALVRIFPRFPDTVVLDAEVSNSTYSEIFKEKFPERFFEMYVAEQNMVGQHWVFPVVVKSLLFLHLAHFLPVHLTRSG